LTSKSLGKIGLALGMTSILVVSLLAGCGGSTTITATATKTVTGGGSGATVTETKTTTVGAGATVTVTGGGGATTVTQTTTATTTVSGGGGTGTVMGGLVIYGDMVTSVGCLSISIGHRGELLVFRARIVDPKTGKDMTDKDIKTDSALAVLPDGQSFKMTYAGHSGANPTDYFWSYAWEIPLNYPTGSLGYEFKATANDGRTGSWKPFEVASSKLTIAAFDPSFVRAWTANLTATGFSVKTLSISQGAKVTFTNKDTIPHSIVGPDFNSGVIAANGTYARVFDKAGTVTVSFGDNPAFTLTITVNAVS